MPSIGIAGEQQWEPPKGNIEARSRGNEDEGGGGFVIKGAWLEQLFSPTKQLLQFSSPQMSSSLTNAIVATGAPQVASVALVPATKPQSVPFNEESFSAKVTWDADSDGPVTLGALQLKKDMSDMIKRELPSGVSVEDVLRHYMVGYYNLLDSHKEGGLVAKLAKVKGVLSTTQAQYEDRVKEMEGLRSTFNRCVKLISHSLKILADKQAELNVYEREAVILKDKIHELERLLEHCKNINDKLCSTAEYFCNAAVQAFRGNPLILWPTFRQAVRNAMQELGRVGDTLTEQKVVLPQSLAIASEWLYELEQFLTQTEVCLRQVMGEASEDALARSGLLHFATLNVPTLESIVKATNSYPRPPVAPHHFLYQTGGQCHSCKGDEGRSRKRATADDRKAAAVPVKKPRVVIG
ncbi:hypothetical protein V5O48_016719 [Marasmius crinis-equi]|uniref:Uncharacterized protein n=1 Tax=Marasmius crinis-equi TaxID=585013 RepID=A0ABR3EQY2_9AGAR